MSSGPSQAPSEEPEQPSISNPELDAPEFPDFENSEMETAEGEAVDIAALELEALDLINSDLPVTNDLAVCDFEDPQPDICDSAEPAVSSIIQDLNLGSEHIIPLDPASFPEPINLSEFPEPAVLDEWNPNEEAIADPLTSSHADETDLGASECQSVAEETQLSIPASFNEGIQPHQRSGFVVTRIQVFFTSQCSLFV